MFDTKTHNVEASLLGIIRLGGVLLSLPMLVLCAIPVGWATFWCWVWFKVLHSLFFRDGRDVLSWFGSSNGGRGDMRSRMDSDTGGRSSIGGGQYTPFIPATPFASPLLGNWSARKETKGEGEGGKQD